MWSKMKERKTLVGSLHGAGGTEGQDLVFLKQPNNQFVCISLFKPLVFQTLRPKKEEGQYVYLS